MTLRTQAMNAVTFKANNEVHLFGLSGDDSSLLVVEAIPEVVGTLPGKKGSEKWEKKYYHSDFGNSANINPVFPMPYPILLLWLNECVVISRKKLLVSVAFLYILFCWDQIVSLGELFIAINQREKTVLRLGYPLPLRTWGEWLFCSLWNSGKLSLLIWTLFPNLFSPQNFHYLDALMWQIRTKKIRSRIKIHNLKFTI